MHAENAVAHQEIDDSVFALEPIPLASVPNRHPVSAFSARYQDMTEGHFIPDERLLLKDDMVRALSCWMEHVEPVELGGHVDFYILSPGEAFSLTSEEYLGGRWMNEAVDEGFVASRYHECVTASILRKPMFSRGAVPSLERSFIMQYRGVFPMFANNHARLRLAIISAETFIELKD
jgi:hypothetical protein